MSRKQSFNVRELEIESTNPAHRACNAESAESVQGTHLAKWLGCSVGLNVALVAAFGLLSSYIEAPAIAAAVMIVKGVGLTGILLLVMALLAWVLTVGSRGEQR